MDGIRINSPFYLAKLKVPKSSSPRKYTLVVSEFEKKSDIQFTLTVYGNLKLKLEQLGDDLRFVQKRIKGEWKNGNAGGSQNNKETYYTNPTYTLTIDQQTTLVAEIRGPKKYSVNVRIEDMDQKVSVYLNSDMVKTFILHNQSWHRDVYFLGPELLTSFKIRKENLYLFMFIRENLNKRRF